MDNDDLAHEQGEEDEGQPSLVTEPEVFEPVERSEDEDFMEVFGKLHKGIMVVRKEIEEHACEGQQPAENEEPAKGDGEEQAEKKKEMRMYIRSYLPQWCEQVDASRLVYEKYVTVERAARPKASASKSSTRNLREPQLAEAEFEENELLLTADSACTTLACVVIGIKGDQHTIFTFCD